MKKRHYIQLVILIIIALFYLLLKTGEHTVIMEPVESVMTLQMVDIMTGKTNKSTTVSRDDQEIEIDRSDYDTEAEYIQAIEAAKTELGFRKK